MIIQRLYTGGNFSTCVFLSFVMIIAFSCKKKPIGTTDSEDCISLIPCNQPTQGGGYYYIPDSCNYTMPCFNPNNPSEFLFIKSCGGNTAYATIFKHNLLNNNTIEIFSGAVWYAPKWGGNDWIIFSESDKNIYKIKSNGDSLTQLTNENCYHYPTWYFDEDKFVAYNECLNKNILFNSSGVVLDTLPYLIGITSSLEHFPYLVNNAGNSINFFDVENEFNNIYSIFVNGEGEDLLPASGSIFWTNENELVFSNIKGLSKLNFSLSTITKFKPSCNSKIYLFGSVNSSKTKMIWSRGDYTQINECTLKYKSRIYIMNIDGSDETEINLE